MYELMYYVKNNYDKYLKIRNVQAISKVTIKLDEGAAQYITSALRLQT